MRLVNSDVAIGRDCWIGARCVFYPAGGASITIGDCCDLGPGVVLCCGTHEIGPASRRAGEGQAAPIIIGDGCWIGIRATLTAGSRLGNGCVVAAAALVRGEWEANVLLAGVPATIKRRLDDENTT